MKKNTLLSTKIKKLYKENDMELSPLLEALLDEADKTQTTIEALWGLVQSGPLLTEFTNKNGFTNTTASASLKELRSWQLVFQGLCRSIHKILRLDFEALDELDDGLSEFY